MAKVNNWDKFSLLLWKNWLLQWNNKWQLVIEILLPAIFSLLMVLIRSLVIAEPMPVKTFSEQNISTIALFNASLARAQNFQKMMNAYNLGISKSLSLDTGLKYPTYEILYSPQNVYLDRIVGDAARDLKLRGYRAYPNAEELENALVERNFFAGVQFDDSLANITDYPKHFDCSLRFPSELRTATLNIGLTWLTMRLFPMVKLTGPRLADDDDGGLPVGYLREGFLPLQHRLVMSYLKLASNGSQIPEVTMRRYPYPEYIYDPLLEGLATMMSLIILLSFIYPCTYITKYITSEKEKQLKEVMKIMGLNNWIHWAAWFVKSFIMLGISSLLIVMLIKIKWSNDVAVLTYSSYTPLACFLFVYTIASICFCFMMATFFSKASSAAAVTGLVWFIAYIPYSFTFATYDDLSLADKLGWSLVSNTAMAFGFRVILALEGTGEGLQWNNMFEPVSVDDSLSLGGVMVMMLIGSVIYLLICLYVEQIFPGDFGVPKKWNFPFTSKFWCGDTEYIGIEDMSNVRHQNPDAFEAEPSGKHVGLQVKNIKKKFGDKYAVKGLSMNMYEDEITVLLGHNGAGKTTTISMLTGMFPPTGGTAIVNGSDIRNNIDGARSSLGVCPQHNVLFDDLTVAEHIIFFSKLKGLKGDAIEKEVDKYLKMIELEDKANVASKKLSGGMKRKLSVCCALCGDTKVVLCDEPSSGMDPSARRQLWDLLQNEKAGRTLLLTTHFMDEADVLGDRVAIMCDGELKCHGTSFFLKKKYGSGYRLICVKRETCVVNEVTELLEKYIPGLQPDSDIGAELSYRLPDNYSAVFEKMLNELENNCERLNLNGYGISITSLEEVFMNVGSEKPLAGSQKVQSSIMNGRSIYADDDVESMQSESIFSEHTRLLKGFNLIVNQWNAMLLKKLLYTFRNKLLFFIQNIMPVFFVVMTILICRKQGIFHPLKPITMSLTQYPVAVTVLDSYTSSENSLQGRIAQQYKAIATSYGDDYEFLSTGTKNFTEYILELGKTLQVRINSRYVAAASVTDDKLTVWLNNQPFHTAPLTLNLMHNAMGKALLGSDTEITITNAPLPYSNEMIFTQLNTGNNLGAQLALNLCFCMCFVSSFYILFLIKERVSRSKLLQFVGGVKVLTFWLTQFLWDMFTFILTSLIMILTILCFQEDYFSTFDELGRYFLLFIVFGVAMLPLTYLMSFWFDEPATGFSRVSIINIFAGMALFLVILVMSYEVFDTKETAETLQWVFRVFPHFSLAMSLNKLYVNDATRAACGKEIIVILPDALRCQLFPKCCTTEPYLSFTEPGILAEVLYMACTGIIIFIVIIIMEYGFLNEIIYKIRQMISKPPKLPDEDYYDEDVERERKRIMAMTHNEIISENLVLDRVTKYYGHFLAVNQISLCVKQMECFGLLGVNGAGKTTTFKMMTGDVRISSGSAYIKGMNLKTQINDIYKEIGYCPQFDALLDDLTGRETLLIFCLLRGIQRNRIKQVSEELAKSFGFMRHIDKETKAYSGGNKRKLSTAVSVIGSPSVIYLDEPTTGMDPAARRQLWNMVSRLRDSGKSIVLTSHSMEECEALCTRLAIMVNGEFKCIGSTQHLKNKFSKGLVLKIKVKPHLESAKRLSANHNDNDNERAVQLHLIEDDMNNVKEFVEREFSQAILKEEFQGLLTFYIPLSSIKWSKIFGLMEEKRDELNIEDYSISQTTLEEIFLEFAKYQQEDPRSLNSRKRRRNFWQ